MMHIAKAKVPVEIEIDNPKWQSKHDLLKARLRWRVRRPDREHTKPKASNDVGERVASANW